MTDTDQIRKWYHSGVVLNHHQRGTPGYKPICNHNQPKVAFPKEGGGFFNEPVHPLTVEAWEAYIKVMIFHDETMPPAGGVDQCRNIAGKNWPSLHAYLCAADLPPNSRKSAAFLTDMRRIKTNSGVRVFRNLSGDRMHDQIDCSPAHLATAIDPNTVIGTIIEEDDDMLVELTPEQLEAINWMVGALASDPSDPPPWGQSQWDWYQDEWTSAPAPLGPVTHIQLAHISKKQQDRHVKDAQALAAHETSDHDGSNGDVDAAITTHSADPDAHHA